MKNILKKVVKLIENIKICSFISVSKHNFNFIIINNEIKQEKY